jgi:hypothetical protein
MKRIFGVSLGLLIGVVLIGASYLIYLAFFDHRVPPLDLSYSHPTTVEYGAKSQADIKESLFVKAGQGFYTYREFCVRYSFTSIEAQRYLVRKTDAKEVFPLPRLPSRVDNALGCVTKTFASSVPPEVPPGEYWYKSSTVYMVAGNPIGTWVWHWPDVTVMVVPK